MVGERVQKIRVPVRIHLGQVARRKPVLPRFRWLRRFAEIPSRFGRVRGPRRRRLGLPALEATRARPLFKLKHMYNSHHRKERKKQAERKRTETNTTKIEGEKEGEESALSLFLCCCFIILLLIPQLFVVLWRGKIVHATFCSRLNKKRIRHFQRYLKLHFISRRGLLHTRFESASSAVTTATRTTTRTTKETYLRRTTKKNGRRRGSRAPASLIVHPTRGQLHHTNPLVPVGWQHQQIASSSCNNKAFGLDDFHDSLLETILSFMDAETILLTGQTCKRLHALCEREVVWAALVNTRFGHRPESNHREFGKASKTEEEWRNSGGGESGFASSSA